MATDGRRPRVLLLTNGPLDVDNGAEAELAMGLARAMPEMDYLWFRRGRDRHAVPWLGRSVPVVSRHGAPGLPERLQVAVVGARMAREADLVHAVLTIGPGFPAFSRLWPPLIHGKPVLHTVPGVTDPELLARSRPLGPTVALSEVTAQSLGAAGFGEVRVIGPMIELDQWPLRPRSVRDPPIVLATGHHDPDGGAYEAIGSAAVAARAGARFQLILALQGRPGQNVGRLERALRSRAAQEGLHATEVLGGVDNLLRLLAVSDIVLHLPRALGGRPDVPFTVLKALATGRPVILSDLPQFAPLKDAVLRAPAHDTHRAGHLLLQLLDRPWWWERLAERGRSTVEERFAAGPFSSRYAELYRRLLA
ncbi:glycosyltransferase family 4 protein [Streptomyces sp. HC44]|uniref:Glycosyltransferase family 4 protein n=1 Tax=Streptomyces scabichelini TaxID=2711217 RepID=A0A6G4VEN6_9ACTN|nr:glycosyltransferase family 4 protein [Streptomyces scabichelini]NGO12559.1 glycosyltransferase family 4 protein [Streptomyces scabichelini]